MPSYVIGLDLGSDCVKAAVLKGSFRGYEVEDFLSLEPAEFQATSDLPAPNAASEDPAREEGAEAQAADDASEDSGEGGSSASSPELAAARTILKAVSQPQALVVASIPAERASAWLVKLPFSDRKRIDQTIGFELENFVPWDLEDVVVDYQILDSTGDGATIFAAMVPRERISDLLRKLRSLDVDPRHISIDAAELSRLLPAEEEPLAILDVGASRTLICVASEGQTRWVRSLDTGASSFEDEASLQDWLHRIRASLLSAEEAGAPGVEGLRITGGGSRHEGLIEALEEELGLEVAALELPESMVNPEIAPRPEPEHALCYALALKGFAARGQTGLGFRKGEFSWQADSRLYTRLALAAVAALAVLAVGYVVMHFVTLTKLNKELDQANQQLISTVQSAFPTVPASALMTADGSIGVMREQVIALENRAEALKGHSLSPLQALRELSETVPDDITVNIDEFMVNDEMLRLRGTTDSFGSVDRIEAAILANPLFPGAKKSDVNKARDSKMRFMVTIPREPEEEEVGG